MSATQKGLLLVRKLAPALVHTAQTNTVCSLICRNAAVWHKLAEKDNDSPLGNRSQPARDARTVLQQHRIEERLGTLVASLRWQECGPWWFDLARDGRGNGLLLPPEGCACVQRDDRSGRGVVIP